MFGTQPTSPTRPPDLILDAWPQQVRGPIAREMHSVLTNSRRDILTVGVVLALYFSSNGVESLRIALNRAYGMRETRPWWLTRLESIAYVLVRGHRHAGAGVPGRARTVALAAP